LSKPNVFEVPGYLALGAIATLVAALVSVGILIVALGPIGLWALLYLPISYPTILTVFLYVILLAAPVSFGLFPLTAYLFRGHPILVQFVIPAVGFAGGGLTIILWSFINLPAPAAGMGDEIIVGLGMISGLIAGAFYGRGLEL
jgi:hypothetical protein